MSLNNWQAWKSAGNSNVIRRLCLWVFKCGLSQSITLVWYSLGCNIFMQNPGRRHHSVVFISDLVLSSGFWAGSSEHQEVVLTTVLCFLCISYPWDAAAISGLDFEVEKVNVAFKIWSIYRTRFWFNNRWSPSAGNNNTNLQRENIFPYNNHLSPPPLHTHTVFALGGLLCEKLRVCQYDQKGFKLKMGVVEENAKEPYDTGRSIRSGAVISWTILGVSPWPSPLLERGGGWPPQSLTYKKPWGICGQHFPQQVEPSWVLLLAPDTVARSPLSVVLRPFTRLAANLT